MPFIPTPLVQGTLTTKADVYAIGVLMWEIYTAEKVTVLLQIAHATALQSPLLLSPLLLLSILHSTVVPPLPPHRPPYPLLLLLARPLPPPPSPSD